MPARLVITDGSVEINLLDRSFGFHLSSWEPAIARYKQGGTFSDSPLSDGRRLVDSHFENVFETFELKANNLNQDEIILDMQELRRLLEKAASYWTADWATEPVWIEARASQETNLRYSLIVAGSIPNDDDPFQMPFLQPNCAAMMDELDLVVEREPFWRADVPGESTCVEITGSQEYDEGPPWHLEFNATTSEVDCGSNAALDNLPAADLMVDGWVRADGVGENGSGYIIAKIQGGVGGWVLRTTANGLVADVDFANISAQSDSGIDEFDQDELWHHVAMAVDFATRTIYLAIGGIWVTSYAVQIVGDGVYVGDADGDLFIGNNAAGSRTWDGGIGWIRISNAFTWAVGANFTPPDRCTLPADVPGVTIAQWIGVENTGATIDNQEGTAALDGTQTNCTFDGCSPEYGRAIATCLDEVYLGNKDNRANITHIFTWSAANGFSANLMLGALPFDLIDIAGAAPAVGDYVAFGIDTSLVDSGPFSSLVLDIGTAISGITVDDWEYSDGVGPTWTNLGSEQDNTDQDGVGGGSAFDTLGVGSIHWEQDALWTDEALNGVTAYWIRAVVTAAPGAHVAPTQQNRDVYSITWPYIEIDENDAPLGDVTALAQSLIRNQSDYGVTAGTVPLWASGVVMGLRSLSRGENFSAYINLSDEQNPSGISVSGAFVNDVTSVTGRVAQHLNIVSATRTITFDPTIAVEYHGKYHAYLRGYQTSGTPGDLTVRLSTRLLGSTDFFSTDPVPFSDINNPDILDLGYIPLPGFNVDTGDVVEFYVDLTLTGDGAVDVDLYDLVLIPVDEWSGESQSMDTSFTASTGIGSILGMRGFPVTLNTMLDFDGIGGKRFNRSLVLRHVDDLVRGKHLVISPQKMILQANTAQRLWFLQVNGFSAPAEDGSAHEIVSTVRMYKVQRYLSMRGSR